MEQGHLAVFTLSDDLHALAVRSRLAHRHHVTCHIIETDRIAGRHGVTWSIGAQAHPIGHLLDRDGSPVDIAAIKCAWWRRSGGLGQRDATNLDSVASEVVNRDSRAALVGATLATFRGRWVSEPSATMRAEQKLLQLRVAVEVGLRVPRTLVSQDPDIVRAFRQEQGQAIVVKSLAAGASVPLYTVRVGVEDSLDDHSVRLSPTLYQEAIAGARHLRVHVFGEEVISVCIESEDLDWRANLNVPISPAGIDPALETQLVELVRRLGLRMGVLDVKLAPSGEPVFLEVNPQGQFLFVQGLTGLDLLGSFSEFLLREASRAQGDG